MVDVGVCGFCGERLARQIRLKGGCRGIKDEPRFPKDDGAMVFAEGGG